jgi:hypothetical protein
MDSSGNDHRDLRALFESDGEKEELRMAKEINALLVLERKKWLRASLPDQAAVVARTDPPVAAPPGASDRAPSRRPAVPRGRRRRPPPAAAATACRTSASPCSRPPPSSGPHLHCAHRAVQALRRGHNWARRSHRARQRALLRTAECRRLRRGAEAGGGRFLPREGPPAARPCF